MLTKDTVEHLLLHRFCDLCSDGRLFQVRKVRDPTTFHARSIYSSEFNIKQALCLCAHNKIATFFFYVTIFSF